MSKSRHFCIQAIIWLVAALSFGACVPLHILRGDYDLAVLYTVDTVLDICLSARHFIRFRKEKKKWLNCCSF